MKKILIVTLGLFVSLFAQAKKPTLMVVPSDVWCVQKGYVQKVMQGKTEITVPDYKKALQNDANLLLVISKINNMMAERGFPLKNLESVLKSLETEAVEASLLTSSGGAEMAESISDQLKRVAKADIILQLTYTLNQTGPKKSITFNLQGLDAYTDKQIAGAEGTGAPSFSAELPVLLEEAVLTHIDNFNNTLQKHFDDLFKNGREVKMAIRVFSDAKMRFNQDFTIDGHSEELSFLIDEWFAQNTVQGRYSIADQSENVMRLEQVRIPLFQEVNGKERAVDTRSFANNLKKWLKDKLNMESKIYVRGLGEAWLILGEK
jgi:hypothetical protein